MAIEKKFTERIRGENRPPPGEAALMEGISRDSRAFCGPEQLHIDLTNKCNLNCIACWHRSPLLGEDDIYPHWNIKYELSLERVISLIDQAAEMGVKKIIYSGGGDSLLYKEIFPVLEHTKSKGIKMLLVSNLTMGSDETIRRIIGCGVNQLLVNLWAGSAGAYVATHPGTTESTFFRVVELLKAFVELRRAPVDPELIISNVICTLNYKDVENMVRLAVDIGACDIWFQTVDVESKSMEKLLLNRAQIDELIADIGRIKVKYQSLLKAYQRNILQFDDFLEKLADSRVLEGMYHSDIIDSIPCCIGWAGCRILANGDVVPCCKGDKHPLGNINRNSFREIWYSRRYDEFRKKAKLLSKSDPYFNRINCAKVCDNWWFNKEIHERYKVYIKSRS